MRLMFDREICGRCGGIGRYSFNQMDGDTCYGCKRTGIVYTPNGVRAYEAYEAAKDAQLGKSPSELKPGDVIWSKAIGIVHYENYRVGPNSFAPQDVDQRYKAKHREVASTEPNYGSTGQWKVTFTDDKFWVSHETAIIRVHNPKIAQAIARQIAAKYKGATLLEGTADEIAAAVQEIDDVMHGRREAKVTAATAKQAATDAAAKAAREAKDQARKIEGKAWRIANRGLVVRMRDLDRSKPDLSRWTDLDGYIAKVKAGYPLSDKGTASAETAMDDYEAEQESLTALEHVGTIGEKITLDVTVTAAIPMEPRWHQGRMTRSMLIKFTDPKGNLLIWFGSGALAFELSQGDTLTITAKVKEHGTYDRTGEKQTYINYVKRVG
jgi:hypothetical protein